MTTPASKTDMRSGQKRLGKFVALATCLSPWLPLSAQQTALPASVESLPPPQPQAASDQPAAGRFSPTSWQSHDWRGFLSLTGQMRYDDNILQTDHDSIAGYVGVLIPAYTVEYVPSGREEAALAHLDYAPQLVGYLNHAQYNSVNQSANLKMERTYGHSQFRAAHHFELTTEPDMEQTGWGRTQTQATDLYAGYDISDKTTIDLAPRQDWSSVQNGLTVWETGAALAVTRHQSEKLDWKASYYAAEVTSNPGSDAFKQSVLGGFTWEVSGRSQLDFNAGFQTMSYQGSDVSSGNVTPDLMLDWVCQITGKTALRLAAGYQTYFSRYEAYQVNKSLSGQAIVTHRLTDKIGLELRGGTTFIQQDTVLKHASNGGDLQYWNVGTGVVYHLNRKTDIRLDYDHQERGGNNLYQAYQRNVSQVSVSYRF